MVAKVTKEKKTPLTRLRSWWTEAKFRGFLHDENGHTPRLWSHWIPMVGFPILGLVVLWLIFCFLQGDWGLPSLSPDGVNAADYLEIIKTALAIIAFTGASLTGVYAYRKQRISEGDSRRSDDQEKRAVEQRFGERFALAAEQLGHDKPAIRMAGVYAISQLADDWEDQRQNCINVLCGYLRMPIDSESNDPSPEGEVRATITEVIAARLQKPPRKSKSGFLSWSKNSFNFDGATFVNFVSWHDVMFLGDVSFREAKFLSNVSFLGATFGKENLTRTICFDGATFEGTVSFRAIKSYSAIRFCKVQFKKDANFNDGQTELTMADFSEAQFSGPANFYGINFKGFTNFSGVKFENDTNFNSCHFSSGVISKGVKFEGTSFGAATSVSGLIFRSAVFNGPVNFDVADWSSALTLEGATFLCPDEVTLGPFLTNLGVTVSVRQESDGGEM